MPELKEIPFNERMAAAEKEIKVILEKYEVDIAATLSYGKFSIIPQVSFLDSREQKESKKDEVTKTTQG